MQLLPQQSRHPLTHQHVHLGQLQFQLQGQSDTVTPQGAHMAQQMSSHNVGRVEHDLQLAPMNDDAPLRVEGTNMMPPQSYMAFPPHIHQVQQNMQPAQLMRKQ
jgi:hypothetical protein